MKTESEHQTLEERAASCPSVSIILLTRNGMPRFEQTLAAVQMQDYGGPIEFIHIDTASSDGSLELAAASGIESRVIAAESFHHARTRNLAAAQARHDILVFLSQDAVPANEDWLARLTAPFCDRDVAAVYGRQVPPEGVDPLRAFAMSWNYPAVREVRSYRAGRAVPLHLVRFSNANAALRRDVWERHPFDERARVCEDQGLCRDLLRAGYRVVYEPDAVVIHCHERTWGEEFLWACANGQALTQLGVLAGGSHAGETAYGARRVWTEFGHFSRKGRPMWAAKSALLNATRWLGVQTGKRHQRLPRALRKRLGLE